MIKKYIMLLFSLITLTLFMPKKLLSMARWKTCYYCGYDYLACNLKKHIDWHCPKNKRRKKRPKCPNCKKTFSNPWSLIRHQEKSCKKQKKTNKYSTRYMEDETDFSDSETDYFEDETDQSYFSGNETDQSTTLEKHQPYNKKKNYSLYDLKELLDSIPLDNKANEDPFDQFMNDNKFYMTHKTEISPKNMW